MNKRTDAAAIEPATVVLIKAGKSRSGKSGRNMNNAGNSDSTPTLIAAAISAAKARPAKLSRENREKSLSLIRFFNVTEFKNRQKQVIPAKADKATTGLGKYASGSDCENSLYSVAKNPAFDKDVAKNEEQRIQFVKTGTDK